MQTERSSISAKSLSLPHLSTSSTSFKPAARGSSARMAMIFQSSSPSSIMASTARGLTGYTLPVVSRCSPISTTSTGSLSPCPPVAGSLLQHQPCSVMLYKDMASRSRDVEVLNLACAAMQSLYQVRCKLHTGRFSNVWRVVHRLLSRQVQELAKGQRTAAFRSGWVMVGSSQVCGSRP